jgi:hypothetical protein
VDDLQLGRGQLEPESGVSRLDQLVAHRGKVYG